VAKSNRYNNLPIEGKSRASMLGDSRGFDLQKARTPDVGIGTAHVPELNAPERRTDEGPGCDSLRVARLAHQMRWHSLKTRRKLFFTARHSDV